MPVDAGIRSPIKQGSATRTELGPAGKRFRAVEEPKRKKESSKKPETHKKMLSERSLALVRHNLSIDSSCSSDSCVSASSLKNGKSRGAALQKASKPPKVVPDGVQTESTVASLKKRCYWITPNADPLHIYFHDEEWGVPVHDDVKLFELLVLSQALSELSWPDILSKREIFRNLFDNFEPSSVAKFNQKKLLSPNANGSLLLSEQKLRAIMENANQLLKVQREFGSFSNYCWRFVNHRPVRNGYRYARQVPAKTPKAELMSKDMMQRGFRCVGPMVVYSFMQAAGMVNDHLVSCFRYSECNDNAGKCSDSDLTNEGNTTPAENTVENTNLPSQLPEQ